MNERLKDTLHRWLPKLAILSVLIILSSYAFLEFYVVPRRIAKAVEEPRRMAPDRSGRRAGKGGRGQSRLRADRGPHRHTRRQQKTQQALSEAVAQEESIGEVWVTNAQGLIVYYGRHNPPIRNVAGRFSSR